jgi:hypothetical protein
MNADVGFTILEHPQWICHNPTPMVLSRGFQDEPSLWHSNACFKSHSTFPRPASEVHLMPFFHPLPEGSHLTVHACNKCDSKYAMRLAIRVQVLEL